MPLHFVMPFYGDESLFQEAVRSVLAQSSDEWRLTVIDDAYPDEQPGRWLTALDHPRVQYIRNRANGGVSAAFRQAVELADEELLTIIGCDDRVLPTYVERAVEQMGRTGATYFQPGVTVIDERGRAVRPLADRVKGLMRPGAGVISGERAASSLLTGNWTYFPSIVWRTAAVRGFSFDPRFDVVLDLHLQLQLIEGGGTMLIDDEPLFEYRRHRESVSAVTAREGVRFQEERALFSEWSTRCTALGWGRAARAARWHLTSRLNALTLLPAAAGAHGMRRQLIRHAVGRTKSLD